MWLVIPAAVGLFLVRTLMIARRLKAAAQNPTLADVRALRGAKRALKAHRMELGSAVSTSKGHLAAAKRLARLPPTPRRSPNSRVDVMVEDSFRVDDT
jgi:hypothetical protein